MATETGNVNETREPILTIRLPDGSTIDCVVDTGFSGGLMVPAETLATSGISVIGQQTFELVSGRLMVAALALMSIDWLGEQRWVWVIASEAKDALIGAELLDPNRLVVDYAKNTVTLSSDRG